MIVATSFPPKSVSAARQARSIEFGGSRFRGGKFVALTVFIFSLGASTGAAPQSNKHVGELLPIGCSSTDWSDAFHPNEPVHPIATDVCPANIDEALFTREGTLACPTVDMLSAAFNAMEANWHLVASAGIPMTYRGTGRAVGPEFFGCSVYHDGVPVARPTLQNGSSAYNVAPLGWVFRGNLRNSLEYMKQKSGARKAAVRNTTRPKLCNPGGGCVYTDVHPYEPVRE
jgi:hypothetical protein